MITIALIQVAAWLSFMVAVGVLTAYKEVDE